MSCFFTLNLPLKKAETKMISQMDFVLYSGFSNQIWTCSLFISISLHIYSGNAYILQHTLVTYSYQSVITFGGCCDDFMVVTSQQREPGVGKKSVEKLVFAMAKPKVSYPPLLCSSVHMLSMICGCLKAEPRFYFAFTYN